MQNEEGGAVGRRSTSTEQEFAPRDHVCAALGQLLRDKREAAEKTLREVCDEVGCVVNTWRKWEAGATMPRADDLLKIGRVLSISPAELLAIDPTLLDEVSP